jgi:DNA polymerase-3 subunit beta
MKIEVDKDSFLKALQKVSNIISGRTTLQIMSNIKLVAVGDELIVSAADYELFITTRLKVEVEREGETTIPGKRLTNLVSKFIGESIVLDTDLNTHQTKIFCGTASFTLLGKETSDFPPLPEVMSTRNFELPVSNLLRAFEKISYSVSLDDARKVLHGVFCSIEDNMFNLVATDGKRLAMVEQNLEGYDGDNGSCIIPLKSSNELKRLLVGQDSVKIEIGESNIVFKTEESILISNLIEGEFPDYKQVIPKSFEKEFKLNTKEFLSKLDLVSLALVDRSSHVYVKLVNNELTFKAVSSIVGEGSDKMDIDFEYPEANISFNAGFLADPFRHTDADEVTFMMNTEATPIGIDGGDGFLYIIMPMKNK